MSTTPPASPAPSPPGPSSRGLRMRETFRTVVADHFADGAAPVHAELVFSDAPFDSDDEFLCDFYNEILHQGTCDRYTQDGVPLLAVLATDDRVPPYERMSLVGLLFRIATVAGRDEAECWPQPRSCGNPAAEARARAAVREAVPRLLARWEAEPVIVRMPLTAIAAAFPTTEAAQALLPELRTLAGRYRGRTLPGDYVRLAGTVIGRRENLLTAVEVLTSQYWSPTVRSAPLPGRAMHLLRQMLDRLLSTARA
ncbi:hypothetical protein ACIRBY_14595 [Streptomyces sp. NPDC096136]|uniref:hypothetical protein n=1 Tax=Streptomyces sp. NPDC096136 TaxID=3366076 RepID=UPI00381B6A73